MKFKFLAILLLIVLASCSDFTMCYYADDFGETGNRDSVNVFVTEQACYYNQNLAWNDEDQSLTVRKCLEETRIQGAFNGLNNNLDSFLAEIFGSSEDASSVKDAISNIVQEDTCSTIDTNISSNVKNDVENVKEAKRRIFSDICLQHCTNLCMDDSSADVSKWVKANLKQEGSFLGIKITENSFINVSVAGTISLTSTGASKRGEYYKIGTEDIDYAFVASPTNSFDLNLQYKNTIVTEEGSDFDSVSDLKNRTILEVKNIETTLVDNNITGTDKNSLKQKYRFQEPLYKYLACAVSEKNSSGFNTASCNFSFSNLNNITNDLKASLNSFYNKEDTEVFDGDYYLYDSSNLNDVTYMETSSTTGLLEPFIQTPDVLELSSDGMSIKYSDYDDVIAGYVWNNNNKDFTIETDYPSKIAIRYIGNTNANCNIKAYSDSEYRLVEKEDGSGNYILSKVENPSESANYTSYVFTAANSSANNNKWKVLKIGGDSNSKSSNVEIVFNQYSVPNKRINSTITLYLDENSDSACSHGLLIKLIPLKDYVAKDTGLLFFYVPNSSSSNNNKKIKYTLINQNLLSSNVSGLEDESPLLKEFYDYTESYSFFGLNENYENYSVGLLSSDQVSLLDENNYNSILSNAIFVRKGQVVRLDYLNWFTIDGSEAINKDVISVDTISADLPVALNVLMKEKYPFFCIGSAEEELDYEDYCLNNGFEYELINVNGCNNLSFSIDPNNANGSNNTCDSTENGYQSKCIMPIPLDCRPTEGLVKKYLSAMSLGSDEVDQSTIDMYLSQSLADFFSNVYKMYDGYVASQAQESGTTDNTALENITALVNDVYNMAGKCFNSLKNDTSISLYKDNNNNEKVLQVISNSNWIFETTGGSGTETIVLTLEEKIQLLLKFFMMEQNIQGDTSYKPSFNLYSALSNNIKETVTQCYDLTNFSGSTTRFIYDTINNTDYDSATAHLYGTMEEKHKILGATKVGNFSNSAAGDISNFKTNNDFGSDGTIGYDERNCPDGNCSAIHYVDKISSNSDYTLALTILNTFDSATNININNYFSYITKSTPVFFFNENIKEYNRNGSRLSVVLADDDKVLAGDLEPSKTNNNFQIYKKGSSSPLSVINEIDINSPDFTVCGDDNPCYLPLVHYRDESFSDKKTASLYKFDESGMLVQTFNSNSYDLNIEANSILRDFVKSNNGSQKNIFFKISDTDDNAENNSGSYTITLKEYTSDDNDNLVDYFRRFFETVFTFVDGNYINILQIDKTAQNILDRFVSCGLEGVHDENCYIYSPLNPDKNGKKCSPGDADCFVGCLETDTANSEGCFTFSDGNGFFKEMYKSVITNPLYILLLKFLLVLSIAFYGFGYFLGMTSYKQSEIIEKIIKVCFIYFMAGPHGFNFFNEYIATFFKKGVDSLLFLIASSFETDLSSGVMQAVTSQNFSDKTVLFSGAFENLEMIFSNAVFTKMLGLIFSGWIGPIYFYLVFSSVLAYITAVITSIIMYLSIQVYMSLIFCFFPLILIFMLFKKTDKTFTNWLNVLIGFAGQEIFLITTLSFFNMLIYNFIKNIFSYTVCWLPLFNITLAGYPLALLQFFKIPNTGMTTLGLNTDGTGMPSFYSILTFYLVGILMNKFIGSMTSLGNSIFGGGMDISGQESVKKVTGAASGLINKLDASQKDVTTGFYKGMANKIFKGKFIEEYGDKELSDRTKKRDSFKQEQNKRTDDKMKKYKESNDYKKFTEDEKRKSKENALKEYYEKENVAAWNTIKSRIAKAKNQEEKDKILNDEINSAKGSKDIISSASSKYAAVKSEHLAKKKQEFSDKSAMEMLTEVNDDGSVGEYHVSKMTGDKVAGARLSELKSGDAVEDAARGYALNGGLLSYKGYNDWTPSKTPEPGEPEKTEGEDEEEEKAETTPKPGNGDGKQKKEETTDDTPKPEDDTNKKTEGNKDEPEKQEDEEE